MFKDKNEEFKKKKKTTAKSKQWFRIYSVHSNENAKAITVL